MSIKIIQERLRQFYQPKNEQEEQNALKEITQEITLCALSRVGFFKEASFQGGTCLRILYGLNRFSEDLDFSLNQAKPSFRWSYYLNIIKEDLETYGYQIDIQDRSRIQNTVKVGLLKDDSIAHLLLLKHNSSSPHKLIKIKLEIDSNPPQGAEREQKYIDFPFTTPIIAENLPSLFAGKSHALLCRKWEKGRDWYDFIWYVSRKIKMNYHFLEKSLIQMGPWANQSLSVDKNWFIQNLKQKIISTDWDAQKKDVQRFLKQTEQNSLNMWSREFFLNRLDVLESYLI